MSDLSSPQDELAHNLHRLQQMSHKPIQMRYAYYCMQRNYDSALKMRFFALRL